MNTNDAELEQFVSSYTATGAVLPIEVVDDSESLFESSQRIVPICPGHGGIDWDRSIYSSGTARNNPSETPDEITARLRNDLAEFRRIISINDGDQLVFLSDDYFTKAVRCHAIDADAILKELAPLPHGICIVDFAKSACLFITFASTSYVFSRDGD